jgi:hypothetical protein
MHRTLTANDNVAIFNYYPLSNPIDKVVDLYNKLLQAKREKVEMSQEVLKDKL